MNRICGPTFPPRAGSFVRARRTRGLVGRRRLTPCVLIGPSCWGMGVRGPEGLGGACRPQEPPPVARDPQTAMRIVAQNDAVSPEADSASSATHPATPRDGESSVDADAAAGTAPSRAAVEPVEGTKSELMGSLVLQDDRLDELSWGELEGKDASQEPWKGRLAALKAGWDDGHYDW